MKLVVKIGGKAAEDAKGRRRLARQIVDLQRAGHSVVVVHGGGSTLTRTLDRLGIHTEFYQGLRVTDAATRDVALMVLAGIVNKQWVGEFAALGQAALGITGGDAGMVRARKLSLGSNGHKKDLGYVGRPYKIRTGVLEMALRAGIVPVVASLGLGARGEFLNINADDLAACLAVALEADRLFYLTESGGVWDANRRLLPLVKLSEIPGLIRKGVVRDGMIPKLRSCARLLRKNVGEIDILAADGSKDLLRAVNHGQHVGTRIVKVAPIRV
ncbi:MAG: acetylglutamate kinase [Terriglobia bacterium]|jgi:acetylglutamate kinase